MGSFEPIVYLSKRIASLRNCDGVLGPRIKSQQPLVLCFATGNTAKMRNLNCGLIEVGRAAHFVFMDSAQHTAGKTLLESVQSGEIPMMIDGIIRAHHSPH